MTINPPSSIDKPAEARKIALKTPLKFSGSKAFIPMQCPNSCAGYSSWTNREYEWYYAEKRFLFACEDEDDCNFWISILNWLIE